MWVGVIGGGISLASAVAWYQKVTVQEICWLQIG